MPQALAAFIAPILGITSALGMAALQGVPCLERAPTSEPVLHVLCWPPRGGLRSRADILAELTKDIDSTTDTARNQVNAVLDELSNGAAIDLATIGGQGAKEHRFFVLGQCLNVWLEEGEEAITDPDLPIIPGSMALLAVRGMPSLMAKVFLGWSQSFQPPQDGPAEAFAFFYMSHPHAVVGIPLGNILHAEAIAAVTGKDGEERRLDTADTLRSVHPAALAIVEELGDDPLPRRRGKSVAHACQLVLKELQSTLVRLPA